MQFECCDLRNINALKSKMKKLADRIFYSDNDNVKSSWNNIGRAHIQLENLGAGLESEGKKDDSNELIMLYKIKDLIEKIENEFAET